MSPGFCRVRVQGNNRVRAGTLPKPPEVRCRRRLPLQHGAVFFQNALFLLIPAPLLHSPQIPCINPVSYRVNKLISTNLITYLCLGVGGLVFLLGVGGLVFFLISYLYRTVTSLLSDNSYIIPCSLSHSPLV